MSTQWIIIQSLEIMVMNNLSVHQRIKKMWHIYNGILFSHEKKGNAVIYDNKDGP